MLETYLATIIIYMIVIYGMLYLFAERIAENGWTNGIKPNGTDPRIALLFLSAIPVLRIAIILCLIYMITHTKEDFEKFKAEHKN